MAASPLPRIPLDTMDWDIGQNQHLGAATTLITACTDYLQALTGLCGTGVQLMRHFVTPSPIASVLPNREKATAQKMSDVWEEVNKITQQAVWSVKSQTLQTLQNWLIKQKASMDRATNSTKAFKSSDLSKLLSSCLLSLMQLQYQFSLINCQSFADLVASQIDQNSELPEGGSDQKTVPHQCPSPSRLEQLLAHSAFNKTMDSSSSYEDIHNKDDSDDPMDDPPSLLLLARRSSYGGRLHNTSSPPPPNNVLGRRWSIPGGGDTSIDEGWTKEIQHRAGSKGSLYVSGVGRAIRGAGNTRRKGSLITKEELEDVIDLLSCKQDARSKLNSSTPTSSTHFLSLHLPTSCSTTDLSPACSTTHLSVPERSQRSGICWDWCPTSQIRSLTNGGLLTVAASQSYKNKDVKRSEKAWLTNAQNSPSPYLNQLEQLNSSSHLCTSSPCSSASAAISTSSNGSERVDAEGAFSIGLNLAGCDLVASVQQRRSNNEKSAIPVVLTPPLDNKNSHDVNLSLDDSSSSANVPVWATAKQRSNCQSMAAFLPFALEGPPGPSIWTPSPRDYSTTQGAYSFELGP